MKQLFFLLIAASFLLTGCAEMADGTSVWAGMLWVMPVLTVGGALAFFYYAYKASKSGSTITKYDRYGKPYKEESDINVPIYKVPKFYMGCILVVATIVIIIMVNADK